MSTPRHGTYARYQAERKSGETCAKCRKAAREYARERRAKLTKKQRALEWGRSAARSRAAWRVAALHRDEFERFTLEELAR